MRLRIFAVAALAMLSACAEKEASAPMAPGAAGTPDAATVRMTAQGEVIGMVTQDGAHSWRGLPFAAPPVGDLRWRAPEAPQGWQGARVATNHGAHCAQISNRFTAGDDEPGALIGSEDCLYLDIYAPPDALEQAGAGKPLAVMVWIHGGSNVWGWGSSYEGSKLALNENVIVIPVQYRLGALGFFSSPLLREDANRPEDRAANFAILDLIASLKWVRDNASAFGGDPENVTIFGESAGGYNIGALLGSPLAKGLFQRAILQSGGFDSTSVADAESADSSLPNPSEAIIAKLGADSADDLRAIAPDALLKVYGGEGGVDLPTIIQDGVTIPATPLRDAFASPETFNAVPIITGTNRDEMKFFHIASPALTKKFLGLFLVSRDKAFYDAVAEYPSRIWRIRAVDGPAAAMAAGGHDQVYAYRFDWDEGGRFLFTDMAHLFGAAHAMELPFVFNRFILLGDADKILFTKKSAASREKLSRAMGQYWANFARNGAPSGEGLPQWPVYSSAGGTLMRLDSDTDGGIGFLQDVDTMAAVVADLKTDPRLDDEQRCAVVAAIAYWIESLAEEIAADIGCAA